MGTHPIFESDFDCLTDFFQIPLSDPPGTMEEETGESQESI